MSDEKGWSKVAILLGRGALILLLGAAVFLVGALGEIPKFGLHVDPTGRWLLMAVGALLLLPLGAYLLLSEGKGEGGLSAKDYGVAIESPGDHDEVDERVNLRGSYKRAPGANEKFWLFDQGADGLYRPRAEVRLLPGEPKWTITNIYVGGQVGESRVLHVVVTSKAGQALVAYFDAAGKTQEMRNTRPGIKELTPDIRLLAHVQVKKRPAAANAAKG
jgi:hypothetical protein